MRNRVLGVMAAGALLASVGVANAKGPVKLADSQLDQVTAGRFGGGDFRGGGFADRGAGGRGYWGGGHADRGFGGRGFGGRGFGDRGFGDRGLSGWDFRGPIR